MGGGMNFSIYLKTVSSDTLDYRTLKSALLQDWITALKSALLQYWIIALKPTLLQDWIERLSRLYCRTGLSIKVVFIAGLDNKHES